MKYTITENKEHNGIEIIFDGKPSEEVRKALKAMRFRWHSVKKCWYGRATIQTVKAAIEGNAAEAVAVRQGKNEKKAQKIDKDLLRAEYAKAWESEKMIDFCVNKVAAAAILPTGEIITVDKQPIETRFCFGESGYDYDEAQQMAAHAATSESYFKRENMKSLRGWLKDIDEAKDIESAPRYLLTIHHSQYSGQADDCRLSRVEFRRLSSILDDLGGSAHLAELPGKTITDISGYSYRIATDEEIALIRAAYEEAAKAHEKKVDAYLKRYGLQHVHSWTYWRDA